MHLSLIGPSTKRWLKTHEFRKLFGISPGTLQNLRSNGTTPNTEISRVILYDYSKITGLFEQNKKAFRFLEDEK